MTILYGASGPQASSPAPDENDSTIKSQIAIFANKTATHAKKTPERPAAHRNLPKFPPLFPSVDGIQCLAKNIEKFGSGFRAHADSDEIAADSARLDPFEFVVVSQKCVWTGQCPVSPQTRSL